MREFTIPRDPNGMGVNIYKKRKIRIEEGVTVLVGCNGYGKSTLLKMIKQQLRDKKIPVRMFDNLQDGGSNARSNALAHGDVSFAATAMCSSEGENIIMNLGRYTHSISRFINAHADSSELWFLFDAIDSGLSVDNVIYIKDKIFKTILEMNIQKSIYIVVSANEYEMCLGEKCYNPYSGTYRRFRSYNAYRKFIIKTAEVLEDRYSKLNNKE